MGRIVIAVVLAGVLGCVATGAAVAAAGAGDFVAFITTPGKHVVSIVIACILPLVYRSMAPTPAFFVGAIALTVVAALVTMLIFNGPAWVPVILFNGVYGTVATLVYVAIAGRGQTKAALRA